MIYALYEYTLEGRPTLDLSLTYPPPLLLYPGIPVYQGTVYITPPGAVFQARLLDDQKGANTERCVFGKLSAGCFHPRPFGQRHYSTCGHLDHGKIAQGGVYTVVCRFITSVVSAIANNSDSSSNTS